MAQNQHIVKKGVFSRALNTRKWKVTLSNMQSLFVCSKMQVHFLHAAVGRTSKKGEQLCVPKQLKCSFIGMPDFLQRWYNEDIMHLKREGGRFSFHLTKPKYSEHVIKIYCD